MGILDKFKSKFSTSTSTTHSIPPQASTTQTEEGTKYVPKTYREQNTTWATDKVTPATPAAAAPATTGNAAGNTVNDAAGVSGTGATAENSVEPAAVGAGASTVDGTGSEGVKEHGTAH